MNFKIFLFLFTLLTTLQVQAQKHRLLIGTYTNKGTSEGIYVYDYDSQTAQTTLKSIGKEVVNPSYLAWSPDQQFVYAVNENGSQSAATAFGFDKNGSLAFLNTKPTNGANPCFITAHKNHVILANYSGGSISVFGRNADGSLTDVQQIHQHTGKSIDLKRQASSHVHQVQFSPDQKYLISVDLGEDLIYIYRYRPQHKSNVLTLKNVVKTQAGTGPRHLAFSPNGKFAYLTHEFNGSITAFSYANGKLIKLQEIATAPANFTDKIDGADIHVSADGKFLYQTNRGDLNNISLFSIGANGNLEFIESISTLGKGPRNFSIDPSGNFLLVAHQQTNEVVIFKRNQETGKLTDSGKRINVGAPVCLLFSNATDN